MADACLVSSIIHSLSTACRRSSLRRCGGV
nr:MAG TPA: hypothetical protein [Caudoviricetes sp.]